MDNSELWNKIEKQYKETFSVVDEKKGILQLKKEFFNELLEKNKKNMQQASMLAKSTMQQAGKLAEHARFIYVPGGEFTMGDDKGRDSEKPAHRVSLSPFFMAEFPVTQELYEAITGKKHSNFEGHNRPVENVSWYDAVDFCNLLSKKAKLQPYYTIDKKTKDPDNISDYDDIKWLVKINKQANGFRLPTEAEWEYAARGGATPHPTGFSNPAGVKNDNEKDPSGFENPPAQIYAGSNLLDAVGWYNENSGGETKPVGLKLPNQLGLYDMSGNVWEWCYDWYGDYPKGKQTNPIGSPKGSNRVLRGGGWNYNAFSCRMAHRDYYDPDFPYNGFRLGFALV